MRFKSTVDVDVLALVIAFHHCFRNFKSEVGYASHDKFIAGFFRTKFNELQQLNEWAAHNL